MAYLMIIFPILCLATLAYCQTIFDVTSYGAVGDGITDDSKAFLKAWQGVCEFSSANPTLYIPNRKTFFLKPLTFHGPCKTQVQVQVLGTIIGPKDASAWSNNDDKNVWLTFWKINGIHIFGNGKVDGRGETWWKSCPDMKGCTRPTALSFNGCNNLKINGLTSMNSPQNHISIGGCESVMVSNVNIYAPADSPNTDGIKIGSSTNVQIFNNTVETGDDCIAILSGSSFVNISQIKCGPGHGISIGSLGKNGERSTVEEIHVKDCSFKGTQNGARIKTWQGGVGFARKITFEDITLLSVYNPIIIDQFYCPHSHCNNQSKAVGISDISYVRFKGTSSDQAAISFRCSKSIPCTNILVDSVNITSSAVVAENSIFASCQNAHGKSFNSIPNVDCLLG